MWLNLKKEFSPKRMTLSGRNLRAVMIMYHIRILLVHMYW